MDLQLFCAEISVQRRARSQLLASFSASILKWPKILTLHRTWVMGPRSERGIRIIGIFGVIFHPHFGLLRAVLLQCWPKNEAHKAQILFLFLVSFSPPNNPHFLSNIKRQNVLPRQKWQQNSGAFGMKDFFFSLFNPGFPQKQHPEPFAAEIICGSKNWDEERNPKWKWSLGSGKAPGELWLGWEKWEIKWLYFCHLPLPLCS